MILAMSSISFEKREPSTVQPGRLRAHTDGARPSGLPKKAIATKVFSGSNHSDVSTLLRASGRQGHAWATAPRPKVNVNRCSGHFAHGASSILLSDSRIGTLHQDLEATVAVVGFSESQRTVPSLLKLVAIMTRASLSM